VAISENIGHPRPVKIGLGKKSHHVSLYAAGAERVFEHPDDTVQLLKYGGFREGDIVVLVQPKLLLLSDYQNINRATHGRIEFEVVGHQRTYLTDAASVADFRALKPITSAAQFIQATGRPAKVIYTIEQAEAILRLWWEFPRRKPGDVKDVAEHILGVQTGTLSDQWVKDLAIKFVGTAKRTMPPGWNGLKEWMKDAK